MEEKKSCVNYLSESKKFHCQKSHFAKELMFVKKSFVLTLILMSCASKSVRDFDHIPGGLSATQVQNEIRKSFPSIRSCYEKSISFRKKIMGRVLVSFRIDESGKVSEASLMETNFREKKLHSCILEKVKTIDFSPPLGGGYVDVSYPFHFRFKGKPPAGKTNQKKK